MGRVCDNVGDGVRTGSYLVPYDDLPHSVQFALTGELDRPMLPLTYSTRSIHSTTQKGVIR